MHQCLVAVAIEPDVVGQTRRAKYRVATAVGGVAGNAESVVLGLAGMPRSPVSTENAKIVGDAIHAICAKCLIEAAPGELSGLTDIDALIAYLQILGTTRGPGDTP